jgi:haloacetate dehalogenase
MQWFEHFEQRTFEVNGARIAARVSSAPAAGRPALLLLHGFPQTNAMWHRVAQLLRDDFYLVMPDLRGYGDSAKPPGDADHGNYSKRTMALDMVGVMDALGIAQFGLCGHDRGARVAHRLAVDHPERVQRLCLIDIAPTLDMYESTNFAMARAYYHWFHLIQPAPLPESMINGNPMAYLHHKLGGWGTGGMAHIEPQALAEYERCFCQPATVHAMCEDYRASAGIDLEHDRESRALNAKGGGKIACDTLVLWGERGVIHRLYDPVRLWQAQCAATVTGQLLPAGHFIAEELPGETARQLSTYFAPAKPE